ncbi:DUF1642 domain-containing protein, partial [Lactococcus lactis]
MTKFEEEFKALTSWDWVNVNLIQQILTRFGNWHSDEEFQELKEQNENQAESILLMLDEIKSLKSQLQQQALPVVPSFVGKWLDSNNLASLLDEWYCHHEDMSSHIREYFERLPYKGPNNLSEMENNIVTFITRAKLGGYKLEKPQLFYLRDELTGQFLAKNNHFKDKDKYFFWTG